MNTWMRIGFIGAGLMGAGMIRNLAAAGHEVTAYARTASRLDGLPATGASSVAAAVSGREVACSCVTDSADVVEVVEAVLAAASPPPILIEMSTIAPRVARELSERCSAAGITYLDCPVSGGPTGAAAGTLAIMCGGPVAAFEAAGPALDAMGDPAKRTHCGPVGSGLVAKLVNNMLVGLISAGTAEAFGVGQRAGLDPELLRRVVMASSGNSWQLENLFPRIFAGDHEAGFTVKNLVKDLGHARDLSDDPLPLGDVTAALFREVSDDGLDYGVVARRFLDLPGDP
jgi:3-hydroxyisobutyrate dehydrogenase-like beta-hydroxyacid dehydrogenase